MKNLSIIIISIFFSVFSSCAKEGGQTDTAELDLPVLSGDEIRVVSYNLLFEKSTPSNTTQQWSNRIKVVKDYFRNGSFDIIGTQEAVTFQVNQIINEMEDYGKIGVSLNEPNGDDLSENAAIFYKKSRFEIIESGNFWFSLTPDRSSYAWDATYPRMCTWGKFREKSTEKEFYVFNAHFWVSSFVQAPIEAAKILLTRVKEVADNYPVICTGDFNHIVSSEPMQILLRESFLHDSRQLAQERIGPVGTYHGFNAEATPATRIDYVLTNDQASPMIYRVLDQELNTRKFGSDHLPVVVDIKIK